jgi:excinuclease ABC subunit A
MSLDSASGGERGKGAATGRRPGTPAVPVVSVIQVRGAAEHNLKDVDVAIERGAITVVTGVSGSGKSSLAFDTVLAEAQRRFFYTLSHYSRQFLDLQARPAVRHLSGLSPAISLAQNESQPSRRATVGTLTDASELLAVVYARFADKHCPKHGLPTASMTPAAIAAKIAADWAGETVAICAPVATAKKGSFKAPLTALAEKGYVKAFIDGETVALSPPPPLAREEKHTIKLIIDFIKVKDAAAPRLVRSIEQALTAGQGFGECFVADVGAGGRLDLARGGGFSSGGGCPACGYSWPRLDSRYFSANSLGRCETCNGLGVDPGVWSDDEDGDGDGEVVESQYVRERTGQNDPCPDCFGTGLDAKLDAVRLRGVSWRDLQRWPLTEVDQLLTAARRGALAANPAFIRVADEVQPILRRVIEVGLPYVTLSRRIRGLSSGEAQRLKLAGILAENLRGVLYVLDEPSQGLHPSELETVWGALARLKANGNTILIVDHDETLMRQADWIIDLGPGGGARGGRLMAKFKPGEAAKFRSQSVTAAHLARHEEPAVFAAKTALDAGAGRLRIEGAGAHNLKIDAVELPLRALTVVSGVSGAGKSSLVLATLYPNLVQALTRAKAPGRAKGGKGASALRRGAKAAAAAPPANNWRFCKAFVGYEPVEAVALIDRRPIAKSSVSIPATYLDVFGELRDLYASLPDAQVAGLTNRSFSLSVEGGRCPECKGRGETSLSMRFLADARVRCTVCKGRRYRPAVQAVKYNGLSMADVLELTLDEVVASFAHHKKIVARLRPAVQLGLGYLKLGQPSVSLSGGEAQRLKLVPHLIQSAGRLARARQPLPGGAQPTTVLIMDEPTTGLHFEDVARLLKVLRELIEAGLTVVTVEHNRDVILAADYLIDIGPGSAAQGGTVLYAGAPAGIKKVEESVTGRYF